jgi:hypothetical protein
MKISNIFIIIGIFTIPLYTIQNYPGLVKGIPVAQPASQIVPQKAPTSGDVPPSLFIEPKVAKTLMKQLREQNPTSQNFINIDTMVNTAVLKINTLQVQQYNDHLNLSIYSTSGSALPFSLSQEESKQFIKVYNTIISAEQNPAVPTSLAPTTPSQPVPSAQQPTTKSIDSSDDSNATKQSLQDDGDDEKEEKNNNKKNPYHPSYYPPQSEGNTPALQPTPSASGSSQSSNDHFLRHPQQPVNTSSVTTTTGGNYTEKGGAVGNGLTQQVGFAITKNAPTGSASAPATPDKVNKVFSEGKTVIFAPESAHEETSPIERPRTVSHTAEPLAHKRLTDSPHRLKIAPVSEEPIAVPEPSLSVETKEEPVSFLTSLWNTMSKPLIKGFGWLLSFFVESN